MKATPPPLPESLGLLIMLKLGGVREFRVEGRVFSGSQVSERARISMPWSRINSCRMAGLSRVRVTADIEQVLR